MLKNLFYFHLCSILTSFNVSIWKDFLGLFFFQLSFVGLIKKISLFFISWSLFYFLDTDTLIACFEQLLVFFAFYQGKEFFDIFLLSEGKEEEGGGFEAESSCFIVCFLSLYYC